MWNLEILWSTVVGKLPKRKYSLLRKQIKQTWGTYPYYE